MKLAILGGGGIRTPMLVSALIQHQEGLGVNEVWLMDIDQQRLNLTGKVIDQVIYKTGTSISIHRTVDANTALKDADFVVTTFRVGGMAHRIIDEKVALDMNVLGQETTGPGGFAMALRTIPVLKQYIEKMSSLCPDAWLLNFANPSGLLTEYILNHSGWEKAVGICDGPSGMLSTAANYLGCPTGDLYMEYFGLNHLGWIRKLELRGEDLLPKVLDSYKQVQEDLGLPFDPQFISELSLIPNEYLHYFYASRGSVEKILRSEKTRGEYINDLNEAFYKEIESVSSGQLIEDAYQAYQLKRWESYMAAETGRENKPHQGSAIEAEGYSGVALNIIRSMQGVGKNILILNVRNSGSISHFPNDAVVEIPAVIGAGSIKPITIGEIPLECLGLMNLIKSYERLTIKAALSKSYSQALHALTIHPLVMDGDLAKRLLDQYILKHQGFFPELV